MSRRVGLAAAARVAVLLALAALLGGAGDGTPPAGVTSWRLDDFDKTYPPNEAFGHWNSRKFAPIFGNGERYFFQFVHRDGDHEIVLKSGRDNSFSVGLQSPFRLQDWPVLEWEWRIVKLPRGGDVRVREQDDQAGAACVIVNPGLVGFESICYLFENDGPKDTPITSTQHEASKYLILRTAKSGDPTGEWLKERRNILQDYKRLFGKEPRQEAIFGFQIDSNDTHSSAEARYRNVYLRKS